MSKRRLGNAGLGRAGLGITAVILCVLGGGWATLGASEPEQAPVPRVSADLTPRQLAGQRIVCGFSGKRAPAGLVQAIGAGEVGGLILFKENIASRAQTTALTAELQAVKRPSSLSAPLIISIDQEGGLVKRFPGPPKFSAAEMGRRGAGVARRQGSATGKSLKAAGLNVDLAPVLDVARPKGFIADQRRAFGSRPGPAGRAGVAFAQGLQAAGVAATAKHFPGLGSTAANTDLRPARIPLKRRALRRIDEAPYRRFSAAGGKLVMVSSARYPALDGGKLPASQSRRIVTGELRGQIGFQGVTITDSLETPAATQRAGPAKVALRTVRAGVDLLLYIHCDAAAKAAGVLANALAAGTLDRAEFEASVDRVMALRGSL